MELENSIFLNDLTSSPQKKNVKKSRVWNAVSIGPRHSQYLPLFCSYLLTMEVAEIAVFCNFKISKEDWIFSLLAVKGK